MTMTIRTHDLCDMPYSQAVTSYHGLSSQLTAGHVNVVSSHPSMVNYCKGIYDLFELRRKMSKDLNKCISAIVARTTTTIVARGEWGGGSHMRRSGMLGKFELNP